MKRTSPIVATLFLLPMLSARLNAQTGTVGGGTYAKQTSNAILDAQLNAASSPTAVYADVQQAVDGIFTLSGFDPTIPDSFAITSQIIAAQLAYNAGTYSPLVEDNITATVNTLSTTWSLPAYTLTSDVEVRQLHVALLLRFPQFLLSDAGPRMGAEPGTPLVRPAFSPLEATLLFSLMVHQKLNNPQYQMTSVEYAAYYAALHSGQPLPAVTDRTIAVGTSLQTAFAAQGAFTLLTQANNALNTLIVAGGAQ